MNPIAAALLFGGESGGSSDPIVASSVTYDNTSSGLSSENVQDAIDEVNEKIEEQPNPMVYKGTLGTGGSITSLPAASPANEGHVYKVKTEAEYPLDSYYYKVTSRIAGSYAVWDCVKAKDSEYTDITKQETLEPQGGGGPLTFDNVLKIVSYPGSGGVTTIEALVDGVVYNGAVYNTGEAIYNTEMWASVWSCSGITYGESIHAKVGDMFISNGAEWTHIPSGDDMVIADEVTYDNTSSSLTSEDVQDAIDEIKTLLDSVETEAEAAQIPTLTKSQYDALTEAQKTDGTLREVKDYTFDGDIKVVYSKAFGSREYYGKVTDEYYVTDDEEYKTGLKAHVVKDYYSIQTGYHTQKEYFDAQGISSTNNGLIAISGVDHNYNDGRSALYLNTYGNNKFDSYNSQNKNVAAYWENSTGSGIASEGTPDGEDGSNQRNGYTSFSYNIPIFATQAEAATYVTTGEGLNKAVNYKNSKKSTVLIRNKEVVGITDSNALPFDGTGSDLSSTNAADAIKEVNSKIPSDIQAEDVSFENKVIGRLMPDNTQGVIDSIMDGYENDPLTINHKFVIEAKVPSYASYCYTITYYVDDVLIDSETVWLNNSSTFHGLEQHRDANSYKFTLLDSIPCAVMTLYDQRGNAYLNYPGNSFSIGYDGNSTWRLIGDKTVPAEFHSGASYVNYDNTDSGLEATDVQGAIDEVSDDLTNISNKLGSIEYVAKDKINSNSSLDITLPDNTVTYLLVCANSYVQTACYLIFAGSNVHNCVIVDLATSTYLTITNEGLKVTLTTTGADFYYTLYKLATA